MAEKHCNWFSYNLSAERHLVQNGNQRGVSMLHVEIILEKNFSTYHGHGILFSVCYWGYFFTIMLSRDGKMAGRKILMSVGC